MWLRRAGARLWWGTPAQGEEVMVPECCVTMPHPRAGVGGGNRHQAGALWSCLVGLSLDSALCGLLAKPTWRPWGDLLLSSPFGLELGSQGVPPRLWHLLPLCAMVGGAVVCRDVAVSVSLVTMGPDLDDGSRYPAPRCPGWWGYKSWHHVCLWLCWWPQFRAVAQPPSVAWEAYVQMVLGLSCQGPVHSCLALAAVTWPLTCASPAVLKMWCPVCPAASSRWATWRSMASPNPSWSLRKMGWAWLSPPPRSMSVTLRTTWVSAVLFPSRGGLELGDTGVIHCPVQTTPAPWPLLDI